MSASKRHAAAGRIGAHTRWSHTVDRSAATAPARQAAEDRWLREVRAEHPDVDHKTAVKMAESRRKAWFARLAMKSAEARRTKRAA